MNISLAITASRWLWFYSVFLFSATAVALLLFPFFYTVKFTSIVLLSILCGLSLRRYAFPRSRWRVSHIDYYDQHWYVTVSDKSFPVQLEQCTVWPWIVVMNVYSVVTDCHYSVVVFSDSVEKHM